MHIARKFELLLDAYRRPDRRLWTGREINEATGGVVTRSYITNLRKGRIENPGYEKLRAIAGAVGFPPELWFEENLDPDVGSKTRSEQELRGIDKKVSRLFELVRSAGEGQPYTDAEVARMSIGVLTEKDVEAIRTGKNADPTVDQIIALADVFGVHPSYFLDCTKNPPLLDSEAFEIFRNETVSTIARESLHLSDRESRMVLNIVRQIQQMQEGVVEG